ncbi:MAG: hypothetical protein ACP5O7_03765 [Phycisphaerae bacterium]
MKSKCKIAKLCKNARRYGLAVAVGVILLLSGVNAWGVTVTTVHPQIVVDNPYAIEQVGTTNVLTGLSATCPDGPPQNEAGIVGPIWTWSIGEAQFSNSASSTFGPVPTGDGSEWGFDPAVFSKTLQESGISSVMLFTLLQTPGYWQFQVGVSVKWHSQDGSHQWIGTAASINVGLPDAGANSAAALNASATPAALASSASGSSTSTQPNSPQEAAAKLDITYTGWISGDNQGKAQLVTQLVVTGKQENIHVGWPVKLGAVVAPAGLAQAFTWTISGSGGKNAPAIANYVPTVTTAGQPPPAVDTGVVTPLNPAATAGSSFGPYYYTAANNFTASVSANGANVQAAKTTFAVAKPPLTLMTQPVGPVVVSNNVSVGPLLGLGFGEPKATPATLGIHIGTDITKLKPAGFVGAVYFAQIYTPNDTQTATINGKPVNQTRQQPQGGIDKYFPYVPFVGANGTVDYMDDSPSIPLQNPTVTVATVSDSAQTWLMYKPGAMSNSIYIPIQILSWSWGGNFTAPKALNGQYGKYSGAPANTDIEPQWTELSQLKFK